MSTHPDPSSVEKFKTMHTSYIKTSKTDIMENEKTIGNTEAPKLEKVFRCC